MDIGGTGTGRTWMAAQPLGTLLLPSARAINGYKKPRQKQLHVRLKVQAGLEGNAARDSCFSDRGSVLSIFYEEHRLLSSEVGDTREI